MTIGNAYPENEIRSIEVREGTCHRIPKTVDISSEEAREALSEPINAIVEAVKVALERTPLNSARA